MIQVQGLTKYYGRVPAIRDLAFHADQGEIVGFLGPNGAGKTTTMRILTGYMPPTSGKASVAGYDVVDESLQVRERIGYLPETVPLYPELTVREYLEYMGRLRAVRDLAERIETVMGEVRISGRADNFIGSLSKGLRQRVGLAQALLHQPPVLILDEPTIGLDPAQIIEVRELVRGLGQDRTVLLSTHILSEAQQICDRVLIINQGRIVAEDTPDNLQAQLAGGDRLYVQVAAGQAALTSQIEALPGVRQVLFEPAEDRIVVHSEPGQDPRAAVARLIVESGHDLLELRPAGISLEEVFLQLTREQEAAE
ncbi:MAG TPA: ABC transporter ATP-binding protein [Anaerolineales bacterium]|jgi:ABC-2 type transport system ATP-binding protein